MTSAEYKRALANAKRGPFPWALINKCWPVLRFTLFATRDEAEKAKLELDKGCSAQCTGEHEVVKL